MPHASATMIAAGKNKTASSKNTITYTTAWIVNAIRCAVHAAALEHAA